MTWALVFVVATALHAGFQLTVSLVVYPGFARVPAEGWARVHAGHSRAIAPLVGVLYAALLVTGGGTLLTAPPDFALGVALAGSALAPATTAAVAAPLHGRLGAGPLGSGPDPALVTRLRRADAVRTLGAVVGCAAAVVHAAA